MAGSVSQVFTGYTPVMTAVVGTPPSSVVVGCVARSGWPSRS
jgi:hypothetical protein